MKFTPRQLQFVSIGAILIGVAILGLIGALITKDLLDHMAQAPVPEPQIRWFTTSVEDVHRTYLCVTGVEFGSGIWCERLEP